MISRQWALAATFVASKYNKGRRRDRQVVSLDTYRMVRARTFNGSRIDLAWPSIIDAILSKIPE